jgi:hypothetical protein
MAPYVDALRLNGLKMLEFFDSHVVPCTRGLLELIEKASRKGIST